MSISEYIRTKEYIVTVNDKSDLDTIYDELESQGKAPPNTELSRPIKCVRRRPASRNTHYLLTEWEASQLKSDPRIKSVELAPSEIGVTAGINSTTQTSSNWDKSSSTSSPMKNWGLLRCVEGTQRLNWGGSGYTGSGVGGTPAQTGTISLTQTGRNVDVVICDENGLVWNHPEFTKNADGTGANRTIQYNWAQHDPEVKGTPAGSYSYSVGSHSTHVAGTVAGNTQGWARDANIYNLYYLAGDSGTGAWDFSYVIDYIREFHRTKPVNPETGRKNPTIVNHSWGMSIFPSEWQMTDITAVTYRGTRYTPQTGTITYTGYSGVCTSSVRLATLVGQENTGNRIVTVGPYVPPQGSILSKPASWTQEGQQAFLTTLSQPDATYSVTVQGPADINLINNVAVDILSGDASLESQIVIKQGETVIETLTDGPYTTNNGGTIETDIRRTSYSLPENAVYTIEFNTVSNIVSTDSPLYAVAMSVTVITESAPASASVTSITNSLLGPAALTASTVPTVGNNDDGFWTLNLPFSVTYLGTNYSTIYVSTNHYLTFGSGSTVYANLGPATPNLPKIMWSCADNSVQRIYYGTEGSAPNRTFRVRIEGNAATSGTLGNPGMVCEYVFYESAPTRIDLQVGTNNRKTSTSGFSTATLNAWGFISGQRIPARVAALDADLEDAYDEGIIMVGAAGNGRWKHDIPGGADWNNTFEMANRYPGSVSQPYYYMRGTSPTANDNITAGQYDLPAICVGSVDSIQIDQKVLYSDCGPGVDIWAPGTSIISSLPSGAADPRNSSFYLGKYSGTSMASPQVAGVLACALEIYPNWKQEDAKAYIIGLAKNGQLTATTGGPTDGQDLQGAPNKFLFYKKERYETGAVFPKTNVNLRPTSGLAYPRPRIRRSL